MSHVTTIQDIIYHVNTEGKSSCVQWLTSISDKSSARSSILNSVNAILKKKKLLNKYKSRPDFPPKNDSFLSTEYTFPNFKSGHVQVTQKRKYDKCLDILDEEKQCAVNVVLDLGKDLNDSLKKEEKLKIENNVLNLSLKKRCTTKYKLKLKRTELCSLKKTVFNLNNRITSQRTVLKRIRSQNVYLQKVNDKSIAKLDNLKIQNNELIAQMASLQNELSSLREKFKDEREDNEYLRLLISDDIGKPIKLYDEQSRKYTKEAQECVYQLLNNNVTTSRVGPVITTVLKLVGMRPNKLPSVSTVNNMNVQRLILAQTQLAEELSQKNSTCLLSDETSKYGTKFEGYHVSDNEGRLWVLGLRNILTKGAKDTLKTFQEILQDISEVSEVCDHEAGKKVLLNIVSTMSDRASTQIKFNELLEEYRAEILQDQLGESWGQMSDNEKSSVTKLNNFFCSLHVLVHAAETSTACLLEAEGGLFENSPPIYDATFKKASEPGCL
ncbi:unnamed protein product [Mytilus edulis]|uniref:Uncharacterized protein n=1 Tax=Mytilus edulis TaxID=6550 RepID=A0A8S3SJK0_MYTED|nr:unnamed protein product [Mytilus edulis]